MQRIALGLILTIALASVAQASALSVEKGRANVELDVILSSLHKRSGQDFLIHRETPRLVSLGHIDLKRIDYPILLVVLRNNGLAAIKVQGVVNIVPQPLIRQYGLPIVNADNPDVPDDEWVTRTLQVKHASAAQLVPILRPLIPQAGHLAASGKSGNLILVSHYANVKRISSLVAELDKKPVQ